MGLGLSSSKVIKTGIIDKKYSTLYSDLMSKRQESDYNDFQEFMKNDILPLFTEVQSLLDTIKEIIKK